MRSTETRWSVNATILAEDVRRQYPDAKNARNGEHPAYIALSKQLTANGEPRNRNAVSKKCRNLQFTAKGGGLPHGAKLEKIVVRLFNEAPDTMMELVRHIYEDMER